MRTLLLPAIENADELETAIRFQAQDHIPMPLDQAVLDWEVIGHTTGENGERRIEVVVVAARRDMVAALLDALRQGRPAAGRDRPLGVRDDPRAPAGGARRRRRGRLRRRTRRSPTRTGSPSGAGEARPPVAEAPRPAQLYCNLGDVTNLAVAQGPTCLFTRISPFGIEGIAQKLAERRQLTLEHARQWLVHVGLEAPVEEIDGDPETVAATREALDEGAAKLVDELRLSLEYYGAQEGAVTVEGDRRLRPRDDDPGLVERLQRELGHPFAVGRPAALAPSRRRRGGPPDPLLRPGAGGASAMRPVNLIPPEERRGDRAAAAHRRAPLRDRRRRSRSRWRRSPS